MRKNITDISGQTFGRWTVSEHYKNGYWKCICNCGQVKIVKGSELRRGKSKSCGCFHSEVSAETASSNFTTHGKSGQPIHRSWKAMKQRCGNPNLPKYKYYGARGIKVCAKWKTFAGFLEDMGSTWFQGATIERKNNNGNYEASNCIWADWVTQANNSRQNHRISVNGAELTLAQAGRRFNISSDVIRSRLKLGWSVNDSVFTPLLK